MEELLFIIMVLVVGVNVPETLKIPPTVPLLVPPVIEPLMVKPP